MKKDCGEMILSFEKEDGENDLSRPWREEICINFSIKVEFIGLTHRSVLMELFNPTKRRKMDSDLSWPWHEEVWLAFLERKRAKGLQSSSLKRLQPNKKLGLIFALVEV
ncbi:hypothetical protein Rs2_31850 [Raphanus sativus]|nr:hypothetical protein Rs2_31850 [Raphanus sativus]